MRLTRTMPRHFRPAAPPLAALLLALALSGCGSSTQPTPGQPPNVAGLYRGAVVLFLVPGGATGDTLNADLVLTQSGAALAGTWRVWSESGADSVYGPVEQGTVASSGTPAVWRVTGRLRVARPGCDGAFDVRLEIVSMSPGPGQALEGTFLGNAPCFRGGGAQNGELTVVQGVVSPSRERTP